MMRKFLLILLGLLYTSDLYALNPVTVPIHDPVYEFLDRMETLGVLRNLVDGVRPMDRGRISGFLRDLDAKRERLTTIDRQRLDNLLADYRHDLDKTIPYPHIVGAHRWYQPLSGWKQFKSDAARLLHRRQPEAENHFIVWEDPFNSFYMDVTAAYTYDRRNDGKSRWSLAQTFTGRGTFGERFGYAGHFQFSGVRGDDGYKELDPLINGAWYLLEQNTLFTDRAGGEISYYSPYINLRFAQHPLTWSLGQSGQLILSDNVEQYPYFAISKQWKWATFHSMHAKLFAQTNGETVDGQAVYPEKWLATHRFEFSPSRRMAFSITDMILYGNRGLEWAYLVPFTIYRSSEHKLRDRDNAFMAVDGEIRIANGVKLYGSILLDEWKTRKIFTDWYGNKHGFLAGAHAADPFGLSNTELRVEYVAIMPWVYTHTYDINTFINDGRSLGYWAGPNSEVIYLHGLKDWTQRLRTGLRCRQWKHGANDPNENIGGDILLGHDDLLGEQTAPRETRQFLEGILRTERQAEFYVRYEFLNDLWLDFAYKKQHVETENAPDENHSEAHFGIRFEY